VGTSYRYPALPDIRQGNWYPAVYRIAKKAGLSGRISGAVGILKLFKFNVMITFLVEFICTAEEINMQAQKL
jgi:hypothetical protein